MNIEKIVTGYLEENCYVLSKNNACLVVDPGDNFNEIRKVIGNKKVLAILITHYHFDHIGALDALKKEHNVPVIDYKSNSNMTIGGFNFKIILTPGHKEDCVTYFFEEDNVMFTGDFLFKETIGRCDLEGGNFSEMIKSIEKIKKYDVNVKIYPGHGESSTIGYELIHNQYLKGAYEE